MELGIGAIVGGKYRIEEKLGAGAIGVVYRVRHVTLKKQLALKVLLPEAARDGDVVARFEREALVGAHVNHPNVAAAIDFGQLDDDSYFLVLELVRGVTLREVVKGGGPLPLRRAVRIALGIASGLAHLHEKGILHRDLKPANVMLVDGAPDNIKLIDFGLARVQADGTLGRELSSSTGSFRTITAQGHFFGTIAYLPPEVRHGMDAVDERSDLYALGVLLFEMLAGRRPFVAPTMVELLRLQIHSPPPPIRELAREPLPDAVVSLIEALLQKEVEQRPASAEIVVEALQEILRDLVPSSHSRTASTLPPPPHPSTRVTLPGPDVDPDDEPPLGDAPAAAVAPVPLAPVSFPSLPAISPMPALALLPPTKGDSRPTPPSSPLVPPVSLPTPTPTPAPRASGASMAEGQRGQQLRGLVLGGALLAAGVLTGLLIARRPTSSAPATASAAAPPPAPAPPSASAPPARDVQRAVAAVREATEAHEGVRALAAVLALGEADPQAFRRPEVPPLLVDLVTGLEQRGSVREVRELCNYLAPRPSGDGADALYVLVRKSPNPRVVTRAREALARSTQLGLVSPALRVTLALLDTPCPRKVTLLDAAAREGDARTLAELQALQSTECFRAGGCCLRQSKPLSAAIAEMKRRGL